jgi:hypothetical protein
MRMTPAEQLDNLAITQEVATEAREANKEFKRLDARIAELEAALQAAYAAMSVARTIDAVRAEYDFEPAIRQAAAALRKK